MKAIILFDGVCNLCVKSVQFVIKRDRDAYFSFASQQSDIGQKLLEQYHVSQEVNSFILIENNKCYMKSSAALRVSRHLDGPWRVGYLLLVIPAPIRNIIYTIVARNRYKWFGKRESCMLPTKDIKGRFLS